MADNSASSVISLRQVPPTTNAKTGAERSRAYRQRRQKKGKAAASPNDESPSSELLKPEGFSSPDSVFAEAPVTPPPTVTVSDVARRGDPTSRSISRILLMAAALALAGVGIAVNGSFAR
jgi:hypothetical protein